MFKFVCLFFVCALCIPWQRRVINGCFIIIKIMEYVCVGVCVCVCVCVCMYVCVSSYALYVCPAMRFAMLRGMGLKLGMGIGDGPRGSRAYFRSDPIKGQRSSRGQVALEIPYGYQIWLEESLTKE